MLDPFDEVLEGLHIGEGVETCMTGRQVRLQADMGARHARSGIASFPVLAGVECLTLLRENDGGKSERLVSGAPLAGTPPAAKCASMTPIKKFPFSLIATTCRGSPPARRYPARPTAKSRSARPFKPSKFARIADLCSARPNAGLPRP